MNEINKDVLYAKCHSHMNTATPWHYILLY